MSIGTGESDSYSNSQPTRRRVRSEGSITLLWPADCVLATTQRTNRAAPDWAGQPKTGVSVVVRSSRSKMGCAAEAGARLGHDAVDAAHALPDRRVERLLGRAVLGSEV